MSQLNILSLMAMRQTPNLTVSVHCFSSHHKLHKKPRYQSKISYRKKKSIHQSYRNILCA